MSMMYDLQSLRRANLSPSLTVCQSLQLALISESRDLGEFGGHRQTDRQTDRWTKRSLYALRICME